MLTRPISRRDLLLQGSLAVAGLALLRMPGLAEAFSMQPGEDVLPWLNQPAPNPVPDVIGNQLQWEALDNWITPNDQFFTIAHYDKPVLDAATWRLQIGGLVQQPMVLTLDEIKARPRQEVTFTLECSGNNGLPFVWGAIGNAIWAGTPLAPLLQEAGVLDQGIEVVFVGSDTGVEDIRDIKMPQHMARSMALADALDPHNLLCYEMNGEPLPQSHGFPLRLIVPGWDGCTTDCTRFDALTRRDVQSWVLSAEDATGRTAWDRRPCQVQVARRATRRQQGAACRRRSSESADGSPNRSHTNTAHGQVRLAGTFCRWLCHTARTAGGR